MRINKNRNSEFRSARCLQDAFLGLPEFLSSTSVNQFLWTLALSTHQLKRQIASPILLSVMLSVHHLLTMSLYINRAARALISARKTARETLQFKPDTDSPRERLGNNDQALNTPEEITHESTEM